MDMNDEGAALDDAFAREEPQTPPPAQEQDHGDTDASEHLQADQDQQLDDDDPDQDEGQEKPRRRTLVSDLQKERQRRQELQQWRESAEKREQEYLQYIQQIQAAQNNQQQQPQTPDFYEDPEGYAGHMQQTMQQQLVNHVVNISEDMARQQYGNEAVEAAIRDAHAQGVAAQFQYARNPFGALMTWHKRMSALREIGDDPQAWKQNQQQQWLQSVVDGFHQWKQQTGQQQPVSGGYRGPRQQRFPGTLASGTQAGQQGGHISEESMLDDVFTRRR